MNTADDVTKGFTMKMALRSHHRVRDTSVLVKISVRALQMSFGQLFEHK